MRKQTQCHETVSCVPCCSYPYYITGKIDNDTSTYFIFLFYLCTFFERKQAAVEMLSLKITVDVSLEKLGVGGNAFPKACLEGKGILRGCRRAC